MSTFLWEALKIEDRVEICSNHLTTLYLFFPSQQLSMVLRLFFSASTLLQIVWQYTTPIPYCKVLLYLLRVLGMRTHVAIVFGQSTVTFYSLSLPPLPSIPSSPSLPPSPSLQTMRIILRTITECWHGNSTVRLTPQRVKKTLWKLSQQIQPKRYDKNGKLLTIERNHPLSESPVEMV